jgi:hypothetical protein
MITENRAQSEYPRWENVNERHSVSRNPKTLLEMFITACDIIAVKQLGPGHSYPDPNQKRSVKRYSPYNREMLRRALQVDN